MLNCTGEQLDLGIRKQYLWGECERAETTARLPIGLASAASVKRGETNA
jgi:hypothetical protein